MNPGIVRFAAIVAAGAGLLSAARAADPPTPGQIFQQQQQPPAAPRLPEKPAEDEDRGDFTLAPRRADPAQRGSSATRKVLVVQYRLEGLTVAPEAAVQAVLAPYNNRDLTITELHEAATAVQEYLKTRGYYARVYVPTQDVKDGVVTLRIVEGRIDTIVVQRGENLRVSDDLLKRYFSREGEGGLLMQMQLERDLLLVNDLAGVRARAILVPGKDPGSTTLLLSALADPFVQGYVSADNAGNKFTGRGRVDADVRFNSPLGLGDLLSVRGSITEHSNFARVGYTLPVNSNGLSVGAAFSLNDYSLCCEFAPLNQNGWARSGNLYANYPLLRSIAMNVSASMIYTDRRIVGRALGSLTSDHRIDSWTPGVFGDWQDKWLGTAARTSWAAQLSVGRVNLGPSPDRAADASTAATEGGFVKLLGNFARVQKLDEHWTLLGSARGQLAGKNLDSSEKFILGGVSGVRAYPTGEAVGDSGFVLNLEAQRELAPQWVGSLFADYGYTQLHKATWNNWEGGNPNVRNRYGLAGGGGGLTWLANPRTVVRVMIAFPLGKNPGRDAGGRNSENTKDGVRFWGSLSWSF